MRQSSLILAAICVSALILTTGCGGTSCEETEVDCDGTCIETISPDLDTLTTRIFAKSCAFSSCHSASSPKEGLDLHDLNAVAATIGVASAQDDSVMLIASGDPDNSYIYRKLTGMNMTATDTGGNAGTIMPPSAPLCEPKLEAVRAWIAAGAPTE